MKIYNNFNEMFNANSNTNKDLSVFNYEEEDKYEGKIYYFEGYDDGTARATLKILKYDYGDYWNPPCEYSDTIEYEVDFKSKAGYDWLKKYGYLDPVDEAEFTTGNTTNEPIKKESWKTFAETLFDWESVMEDIDYDMSTGLWEEVVEDVGNYRIPTDDYEEDPDSINKAKLEDWDLYEKWNEM